MAPVVIFVWTRWAHVDVALSPVAKKQRKPAEMGDLAVASRQLSSEQRKQEIRAAAVRCFLRRGFGATRLTDIAQEANLSKGGIFFHYPAKEVLFHDILEHQLRTLEARWSFEPVCDQPADRTLTRLVIAHVRTMEDEPEETQLQHVLVSATSQDPAFRVGLGEVFNVMRTLYEGVIQRGMEEGVFRDGDASTLARCVLALVQGLGCQSATDPQGRIPVRAEDVAQTALHMLGTPASQRTGRAMDDASTARS